MRRFPRIIWLPLLAIGGASASVHAAERITLRNGFDLFCDHRTADGGKVRLYMDASNTSFLEVDAADIVAAEQVNLPGASEPKTLQATPAQQPPERLSEAELRPILEQAGATYDIDADLLASVVRQESGGHAHAVSRAGAAGLMQLMPGTASKMGVANRFAPGENIHGGTAYLNALLNKYKGNLPLALAAYNAGPAAVDRWHGIPPYPETRAYVARVIHEYNRRYMLRRKAELRAESQVATAER